MRSRSEQPLGTLLQLPWQIVVILYHLIPNRRTCPKLDSVNSTLRKSWPSFCTAQSAAFRSLLWATAPVSSGKWALKRWINESANLDPRSFAGICLWKNRSPRPELATWKGPARPAPSNAASVEPAGPDAEWSLSCLRFSCVHPHGFIWLTHVHSTSFDTKKIKQNATHFCYCYTLIGSCIDFSQQSTSFYKRRA